MSSRMRSYKLFHLVIIVSLVATGTGLGQPYWIYGLFSSSSCTSRFEFSCANVRRTEENMRKMIQQNEKLLNVPMPFCSRDVGDKMSLVVDSILPLILQDNINLTNICRKRRIQGTHDIKGVIVFTFVTFELTQFISSLLQPYHIPLYAITYQPMYPRFLMEKPLFVFSYEGSFGKNLHQNGINSFRKELNITLVAIVNLVERSSSTNSTQITRNRRCDRDDTENAFCIYYELGLKDGCIKEKSIDVYDIEKPIQEILKNPRISIVVLYGSNSLLGDFHNQLLELKKRQPQVKRLYFVKFEKLDLTNDEKDYNDNFTINGIKSRLGKDYQNIFYQVPGALALNSLMYFTHDFKKNFFQADFINRVWKNMKQSDLDGYLGSSGGTFSFLQGRNITPELWKSLDIRIKNAFYETLKYNTHVIGAQMKFWKETFYVNMVKLKELYSHKEYSPGEALKAQPFCHLTKPACISGTELTHSYYTEKDWDTSYGWFCRRCPKNYYRTNQTRCIQCSDELVSNEARTTCYDPYRVIIIEMNSIESTSCFIVAGILIIFIVFTFFVFWKHRGTPLVRASNKQISFLQITTHFVLTILIIPVFLGHPDQLKCTARPIIIGVCFTLTTAINLGKTQKVLLIFKAKLRMSRREIAIAKASTLFTILFALALDAAVLAVSIIMDAPPRKQMTLYKDQLRKEFNCSNNEDVHIQFVVIFFIAFCNAVQGIRARHVPSHYRETSYVTYSSFTSSVVLIGAVIVYVTQVSENAKTITLWYTSLVLNFVHFVLMYHYKMYVMLFRPERNTKAAYDAKRKARFQKSLITETTPNSSPIVGQTIRLNYYGEVNN